MSCSDISNKNYSNGPFITFSNEEENGINQLLIAPNEKADGKKRDRTSELIIDWSNASLFGGVLISGDNNHIKIWSFDNEQAENDIDRLLFMISDCEERQGNSNLEDPLAFNSSNRVFNTSVLKSATNLKNFFNRSNSIQEVLSKKDESYSEIPIPIDTKLDFQWRVCKQATAPYRWILANLSKVAAAGLNRCNFSEAAKKMKNLSVCLIHGFEIFSNFNETSKVSKIASSINGPNKDGEIVNNHPPIPENQLDEAVQRLTFISADKEIKFGHNKGICRGMSFWFIYLYLHTKDQFNNPRAHMAALGEQFKTGGGMDPTLLQSICLDAVEDKQSMDQGYFLQAGGYLLNLKVDKSNAQTQSVRYSLDQWRKGDYEPVEELDLLPAGAYAVSLPEHQTVFIKINRQLGYFFDPNFGIVEIQGSYLSFELHDKVSHSLIAIGHAQSPMEELTDPYIRFIPITLRTPYVPPAYGLAQREPHSQEDLLKREDQQVKLNRKLPYNEALGRISLYR